MSNAVEYLNYEGNLIHVLGGETSMLKITHRVENGRVTERLTSEDAGREIIRDNDETMCIFPDRHTVLVEEGDDSDESRSALRRRLPGAGGISQAFYNIAFAGTERIAGRNCQIIAIRPKDAFRYGYRLSLDRVTAMPLKTQLVDERGHMMEEILFSEITLPESIPDSAVQPTVATDSFSFRRSSASPSATGADQLEDWESAESPPGFKLTVHQARVAPDARSGLRHLVYSDGLATVSLFIEPAVAASEQAEGLSQIGAANAYTTTRHGHMITAVGEVPARTVEIFALSARPSQKP